jgi:hypothetical protein
VSADPLLEHAAAVAEAELRRARGSLRGVDPEIALVVQQAAHAVAAGVARWLAETAERDPSLAGALLHGASGPAHRRG